MNIHALMEAWEGRCAYCATKVIVDADAANPRKATVDQFIPHRPCGTDAEKNQVLACNRCSTVKAGIDPRIFMIVWLRIDRMGFVNMVAMAVRFLRMKRATSPKPRCVQ